MSGKATVSDDLVEEYFALLVNRRAYTLQTTARRGDVRSCYYYRPKRNPSLSADSIRRHLLGEITVGLYAVNPATQRCKWVAVDADYSDALTDLLKLQWELRNDGVESALERSRRGGHLWIFADEPLLASQCRLYVRSLASRIRAPIPELRTGVTGVRSSAEEIEIFPKQDRLSAGEFGNAIRGPLGVHRGAAKRYWFYGAAYDFEAQLEYLKGLAKVTEAQMVRLVRELPMASEEQGLQAGTDSHFRQPPKVSIMSSGSFSLLRYLNGRTRKSGRNYFTQCPSCARQGRDRHGDNLAISVAEPGKYRCWAGCTKEEIRAALGLRISGQYCVRT